MKPQTARFEKEGFLGPIRIWDPPDCPRLLVSLERSPAPDAWAKGNHAVSRAFFDAANHPEIVRRVVELIGPDVILWGSQRVVRAPGERHPWHTDVEGTLRPGRIVSVWIGLENTCRRTSLQLIPGSHRFGEPIQKRAHADGIQRDDLDRSVAEGLAKRTDPRAEVREIEADDGEAVFFDGELWHGSDNRTPDRSRTALLLQYATPDAPMRIPDYQGPVWPFRFLPSPRPPCILMHGTDRYGVSRMVEPPVPEDATLAPQVHGLTLPLPEDARSGWKAFPLFEGSTPAASRIGCHVSVLSPGRTPHPPHIHPEEEILIVLDGSPDLVLDHSGGTGSRLERRPARRGTLAYYPSGQHHTIHNPGPEPATYLMFKWRGKGGDPGGATLGTRVVDLAGFLERVGAGDERDFAAEQVFDGTTGLLPRLECHTSRVLGGGGYLAHRDAHDVALLIFEGELNVRGDRLKAPCIAYLPGGVLHGLENPGTRTARYLVFEFHPDGPVGATRSLSSWLIRALRLRQVARAVKPRARRGLRRAPPPIKRAIWEMWDLVRHRFE